ncbi:MAG: ATP-binding protein, partial [Bacteroidota bacterium]|nr:ATP-binding protein [Bacteroidota bacterium]
MTDQPTSPPPAYFLSLSLENVRSFGEKQTISFARPDGRPAQWTIILGDNGVGKTTVLKSLASLMNEAHPLNREANASIAAMWRLGNTVWRPYRHEGQEPATVQVISVEGFRLSDDLEMFSKIEHGWESEVVRHINGISGNPLPDGLICYGYGAGRTTGNSTLTDSLNTSYPYDSLFDDRADLLNPEEWFLQMEYSSLKGDTQAGKSLEQIREALLLVLPDVTNIRIASKGQQQYLELQTPYGWVR